VATIAQDGVLGGEIAMRPAIRPRWRRDRSRSGCGRLIVLVLLLPVGLAMSRVRAQENGPNVPSPAHVGQAVIAQGVSEMPAAQIAWRVVRDTADPPGAAEYEGRALGFAVAAEEAILVSNQSTGQQELLASGEASFVPSQSAEKRESMGAGTTHLFRIALVPAEQAGDDGGDEMVLAGAPFAAPEGKRDVSLVAEEGLCTLRDSGRSITRTAGDVDGPPMLVVVTEGELQVMPRQGEPVKVGAGRALEVAPPVTLKSLRNSDRCTSYLVAVIGPQVP
jgi:hypothetical protein